MISISFQKASSLRLINLSFQKWSVFSFVYKQNGKVAVASAHAQANPLWLTYRPSPALSGGSLPATVVQHATGPIGSWCGSETETLLQERHKCRRPAASLHPILSGSTILQYGAADGSQERQLQKSE